ncbi:MAG: DMT family transporter [Alphaproteobacteria bacterium]
MVLVLFQSLQKKQALGWKVLSYACFAGIAALVRHLSTFGEDPLSPFELAFFELFLGAIFLGAVGFSSLKSARPIFSSPLALTRAFFASIGIGLWCVSLKYIPLATLSVFKLLSPLLTVFAAHLFLKEPVKRKRFTAFGLCLAGICLLFYQHFQAVWNENFFGLTHRGYAFIPLLALGALSASHLMAKQVLKQVESWDATFSMLVWGSLFLSIPTVLMGTFPTGDQLPWLVFLGLLSGLAYYALNRALELADITYLMPLSIVRFVFGALLGYVSFDETVSPILILAVGGMMLMTVWFLRYEDS